MKLKINEILKERGMRMADLAKKLNVDQSNLSTSLKGNPKLSTLADVASALGVEVQELFPETKPSFTAGTLQMGDKHYVLVPVEVSEKPFIFRSERFLEEVERFTLRCIRDRKTIYICGLYEGYYPFALLNDSKSGHLLFSFCPEGDDYRTTVYDPQKMYASNNLYTDELVANYIARDIKNDIEECL